MKLLVVGSGGREHAVIRKLKENPKAEKIYCAPGNGGISADAECVPVKATDIEGMVSFAKGQGVDFVVVTPDDPLVLGMVDALHAAGIRTFGPDKAAAQIEGSKVFSKNLMKKYGIPTAAYEVFSDPKAAIAYIEQRGEYPVVTGVDIILTPIVTIVSGGLIGDFTGAYVQDFMSFLGGIINTATELSPIPMGIIVSVVVGMALTAPISSAALCIMLDLSGIAAGAATVGCCAQMVGFAVMGFKENGWGGLVSVGVGTSMLQFSNIMRRPMLWVPPTLAGAILGPISTRVLGMTNTASGAGMGTSGLVGQFGTVAAMGADTAFPILLAEMAVMQVILPAVLTMVFYHFFLRMGWIKSGDLKMKVG